MLELSEKDKKNYFNQVLQSKGKHYWNEWKDRSLHQRNQSYKKNQIEILELKNTIKKLLEMMEESVNLKIHE